MAEISIDTVYQKVLAIANKEQRGYITPQEFNLFANHAQMDIFEQYFYDTNQFKSAARPVYVRKNGTQILLYPTSSSPAYSTSTLNCHYVAKPATVKWTYTVSGTYKALYNASASDLQNFELHLSEEANLVVKILQLAGVSMKDQFLTQVAGQKEANDIQQEKQ